MASKRISESSEPTAPKTFDSLLEQLAGGSGPWQRRQFSLLLLQSLACTAPFYLHMFAAYTPAHRCRVAQCEIGPHAAKEPFLDFALPRAGNDTSTGFLNEGDALHDRCWMFASRVGGRCVEEEFDPSTEVECAEYVYDRGVFERTIVTELDLVCGEAYKVFKMIS